MKVDFAKVRSCLKSFDFSTLFREHLGWDKHQAHLDIPVDGGTLRLNAIAQKRGFTAFVCDSIPERNVRLKVDQQVTKSAREHFVIYGDKAAGQQVWHWVRREPGKPMASRDHRFDASQKGDALIQRLEKIAVSLAEEEQITIVDVADRTRSAFDVDKVTKKFYDRFKKEHGDFLKFIKGIKSQADLEWYTSLMLNRLMFVYFIQKKGFLDGDTDYLRNRLKRVRELQGKDRFHSFYSYFLLKLFHDALGKHDDDRKLDPVLEKLIGKVPYLNGGFFEVHQLEERNPDIKIEDKAFEKLFNFFDDFRWHLDERPLRADNEINPDVVGYIFEKYINQKQMGAYYTKEDITEYIGKNTIIPFLFDAAEKKCPIAFKPDSFLWRLLRDNPNQYIHAAVQHGLIDAAGQPIPLPPKIEAGVADASKRDGWNKPAPESFGLPTETWREHVARRERCLEIREKLVKGEVHQINELITFNLDIWQFARDAITSCEGPELLRGFWQAIQKITVLDPTCGSGAFLFAGLRILETLYDDCLARMREFVEDQDQLARGANKGMKYEKFSDFREVLAKIDKHASKDYFVLKSIIINNLYGVDIMEEAVEICKLRLFLKLVAQVEKADQIEPLPDIDFNIRAGNTLVGYASLDEVRTSQAGTLGFGAEDIKRIEDEVLAVEASFRVFRDQQTKHGGKVTTKDKQDLRGKLAKLDAELDQYLAGEYGVKVEKPKDFDAWKASHQPFHWFVEFYPIMRTGGFDVIIGNPPYVEYTKIKSNYTARGLATLKSGNLYGMVCEIAFKILNSHSRLGMIVPMSLVSTARMESVLNQVLANSDIMHFSHYSGNRNPSVLFEGVEMRLTICIGRKQPGLSRAASVQVFSTEFRRWAASAREHLFPTSSYVQVPRRFLKGGLFPKVGSKMEASILSKLLDVSEGCTLGNAVASRGSIEVYAHRIASYFVKALTFIPRFSSERDGDKRSEDYKVFSFSKKEHATAACCIINSSLFYLYYIVFSDAYHCGKELIHSFPVNLPRLADALASESRALEESLMSDLKKHSDIRSIAYKTTGRVEMQKFFPKRSKHILDDIDAMQSRHFGFSADELDFIINYDIKYRMGQDESEDEE